MQITLNQAEIETALTSYINDQVNLKEGVQIVIDLKAGRGPEGFSANIDISSGVKAPVEPAVVEQKKADPKPEKAQKAQTTTGAVAGAANNAGNTVDPQPEVNEQEQQQADQQQAEAQAEQQQETQEEAQAEVKPRTSLFGGLKKPTN